MQLIYRIFDKELRFRDCFVAALLAMTSSEYVIARSAATKQSPSRPRIFPEISIASCGSMERFRLNIEAALPVPCLLRNLILILRKLTFMLLFVGAGFVYQAQCLW